MRRAVDDGAGGKIAYRVHVESLARQGDLDALAILAAHPKPPKSAGHVWGYFHQLGKTRGSNGFGPNPLSRVEIRQWEVDEGIDLAPWERRAILTLDQMYLASLNANEEGPQGEAAEVRF